MLKVSQKLTATDAQDFVNICKTLSLVHIC